MGDIAGKIKLLHKLFQSQTRLFDDALQRAGLERFVLRNDDRALVLAKNQMRASLANLNEAEPFQSADGFDAVDIAGIFTRRRE
jgi:hypothetical protein